jgi:hypothetical protein
MNLKQIIREEILNIVHEVGEGTAKIYDWRFEREIKLVRSGERVYKYVFDSENIDYVVTFNTYTIDVGGGKKKKGVAVTFYADDSGSFANYEKSTNLNELYNVMATVMDIILDFMQIHDDVEILLISPSKAFEDDNRRANLYRAYINKNISKLPGNWKMDSSDPEEITITKID